MKQNRENRSKSMHLQQYSKLILCKVAKINTGGRIASSTNGAGKMR
jgi:hypothetical protein